MRTALRTLALLVALTLVATACGDDSAGVAGPGGPTTLAPPTGPSTTAVPSGGWIGADGELDWAGGEGGAGALSDEYAYETSAGGDDGSSEPAVDRAPLPVDPIEPPLPPDGPPIDTALTAGAVDDNEGWEDYLLYLQQAEAAGFDYRPIEVGGRRIITVRTPAGAPVLGATVVVSDQTGAEVWRSTTHADGRTLFLAPVGDDQQQAPTYTVTVSRDGVESSDALPSGALVHEVALDVATPAPLAVDLLFLIDATGSMSDEIERLKANMVSVAEQIDELPGETDVRFAMTVYRDQGDLFVTRTFDFTPDVEQFTEALREVVADGGGDTPEDLNAGLHEALTAPAWRAGTAVQLVFLIADAPPHLDYDGPDYAADALDAASRGVKVFPVASSGLDPQGEYVFRQLAQVTMGRFVFLTYGADGASPGSERPDLNVDDYSVLALDELVVQLVTDEIAAQG